jgi:hypothetical protein
MATAAVSETMQTGDFGEVVALHLSALGLPFEPGWLDHEITSEIAS